MARIAGALLMLLAMVLPAAGAPGATDAAAPPDQAPTKLGYPPITPPGRPPVAPLGHPPNPPPRPAPIAPPGYAPTAPLGYAPISLNVACGELSDAPCAKVLPKIATHTSRAGLEPRPMRSGEALDTLAAVCQGEVAAAILPADVLASPRSCVGRYDVVGRPLFPLYAVLTVSAGASFRSLDDMAAGGARVVIAPGPESSAARITLRALMGANPALAQAIEITGDDAESALRQIASGTIDGLFSMASLDSALLNELRMRTDGRGAMLYRVIDIRAAANFYGHCLYRLAALDFGTRSPITTLSVDAVMIVGRTFRAVHARGGPFAPDALASAIDATRAAILADMKSPADWRPAGASCH